MALVTVSAVKTFLGITGTAEDAKLAALVLAADRAIKVDTGCDIESGTYGTSASAVTNGLGDSGYYSGDNSEMLLLRQRPVTAVASIYVDDTGRFGDNPDGAFASSTLLTAGTDYVVMWDGTLPGATTRCSKCAMVKRLNGLWPGAWRYSRGTINPQLTNQHGNIKVSYTAGYTTVPADIAYACTLVVAFMRRTVVYAGMNPQSEHYEDYGYSLMSATQSSIMQIGEVRQILNRYKEVWI